MMPGIQYGLGVEKDGVYIRYVDSSKQKKQTLRKIESVEDFVSFIKARAEKFKCTPDDFIIMCSSSMDFPDEYTKNKKVIKLAHALR
jgi:hypothetical protein